MSNNFEYRVETTPFQGESEADVRTAAARFFPAYVVQGVENDGKEWTIRLAKPLVKLAEPPPFLKKKDDAASDEEKAPSPDDPDGDGDDDSSEEGDTDDDGGTGEPGAKGDPVKQIQKLLNEVQKLFSDLKDKADKVDEIHDSIKDHVTDSDPLMGPPDGGGGAPPMGPGGPPRRPGVPSGRGALPPGRNGLPSSFTKHKVARVEKLAEGQEISLAQALAELELDERFQGYKVVDVKDDGENYVAKLELQ